MKRTGLAWRIVVWMLSIAWIPVIIDGLLDSLFRLSQRGYYALFWIIPYIEFISIPLTLLASLIAVYKAAKAVIDFVQRGKKPN